MSVGATMAIVALLGVAPPRDRRPRFPRLRSRAPGLDSRLSVLRTAGLMFGSLEAFGALVYRRLRPERGDPCEGYSGG